MKKTKDYLLKVLSNFLLIAVLVSIASCETSRVSPVTPRPNPPASSNQPLILSGYVRDVSSRSAITGVTVNLFKTDGITPITTLSTSSNGNYQYNATDYTESVIVVKAHKDGYGFKGTSASIDKTGNTVYVEDILLEKLQGTSTTVTQATGGQVDNANNESLSNQPLNVQVPPNAVSQNTQITVASIPVTQIPTSTNANQQIQTAGSFEPTGTQFSTPVTITFPLPSKQAVGKTFPLLQLDPSTSVYSNSGFTATVDATGTQASAQVTHFTIYALEDNGTLNVPDVGTKGSSVDEYVFTIENGDPTQTVTKSVTTSITISGSSGEVSSGFSSSVVAQKLNITIGDKDAEISASYNIRNEHPEYINSEGLTYNPDAPNESGDWVKTVTWNKYNYTRSGSASGGSDPNGWTRNVSVQEQHWEKTSKVWTWRPHNQGSATGG